MKCESCLYKHKSKYLGKEVEQLQTELNNTIVQLNYKLTENLLLKDKIKHLEKELKRKIR